LLGHLGGVIPLGFPKESRRSQKIGSHHIICGFKIAPVGDGEEDEEKAPPPMVELASWSTHVWKAKEESDRSRKGARHRL
jgi:hypothetical protein